MTDPADVLAVDRAVVVDPAALAETVRAIADAPLFAVKAALVIALVLLVIVAVADMPPRRV